MSTNTLLMLGVGGAAVWYFFFRDERTNNPVQSNYGATYVPPPQAIPTYGGRPSPSAPGASAWGMIPPQPTDAQQAAQVITAIGGLANSFANVWNAVDSE